MSSAQTSPPADASDTYRGQRLGLPENGAGSMATFARRLGALAIDWGCSILVVLVVTRGHLVYGSPSFSFAVLGVFGVEVFLLTWLAGGSFAQRLVGIHVVALDRGALGPGRALLRTVLICLALPPLIWDRDGRGLHDRAVNSVVLRSR